MPLEDKENHGFELKVLRTAGAFKLANTAVLVGFPSWAAVKIFEVIADKTTILSLMVDVFGESGERPWEIAVYISLTSWAVIERQLRFRKVRYLEGRIANLERLDDPERLSSGLAKDGRTNPRDKLL